jgi:maleate isomerase
MYYLDKIGVKVVGNVALGLPVERYGKVTPQEWHDIAVANDRMDADAIFLSCAATTQIDAVAPIEATLGKPVVNSNQAVLWAAMKHLRGKLGPMEAPPVGSLMKTLA